MSPEITLIRFNAPESTETFEDQLSQVKKAIQTVGGKYVVAYLTQGRYDAVVISEMPNPEHSASVWLAQKQQGWTTETLIGIPENVVSQVYANARQFARQTA